MKKPYIIAVAGGSGSGKTTIIKSFQEKVNSKKIAVFSQDHYYKDLSGYKPEDIKDTNFDNPGQIDSQLMIKQFNQLISGHEIQPPQYDFKTHTRSLQLNPISTPDILFFDGIFALYFEEIRQSSNLKIYIDVPDDIRIIRRIKRDIKLRGRSLDQICDQYQKSVKPMHERYVQPSKIHADLILNGEQSGDEPISLISRIIEKP